MTTKDMPHIRGKNARVLRVIYAGLSALAAVGAAATVGSLLVRNPREAAIICGCVAVWAIIRLDVRVMDERR